MRANTGGFEAEIGVGLGLKWVGHKVEKNLQDEEIVAYLDVEYAENKVENILVTGHSCCGGIRALMSMEDEHNSSSFIKNWVVVENILMTGHSGGIRAL
nr:beta carbonic anhydrase 5, chloroplastic-like isoform X1 [Tanacetum cinerariifolium]